MIIMKRIKTDTEARKVAGQANTFEGSVERPLDNGIISQGIKNFRRNFFALCKVNDGYFAAIDCIAEEQNFKARRFRIFINTTLGKIHVAVGLDIYGYVVQSIHLNLNKRQGRIPAA